MISETGPGLPWHELFASLISERLHAPFVLLSGGEYPCVLAKGIRLVLEDGQVVLEGEESDAESEEVFAPLYRDAPVLKRLYDTCQALFLSVDRPDGTKMTLSVARPQEGPIYDFDCGLRLTLKLVLHGSNGDVEDLLFSERLVATSAWLTSVDWATRFATWKDGVCEALRHADIADCTERIASPEEEPEQAIPDWDDDWDEGWEEYASLLGLGEEAFAEQVAAAGQRAQTIFKQVEARYRAIYHLKLPKGIQRLAGLVFALGQLPSDPPEYWLGQSSDPWSRGSCWLDQALGMRPAGILEWFAPRGLDRKTVRLEHLFDPSLFTGKEGPLDARLDMRFRRDAPNFVTFAAGDSDGSHWGFWYDSPDYFPLIAHNWARDSAETGISAETVDELLTQRLHETRQRMFEQLEEEDERPYALRTLRAGLVVRKMLDLLCPETDEDEPLCPWPRTLGAPIGSPSLALPPGSGDVPDSVPGFGPWRESVPAADEISAWITAAGKSLEEGHPAYAYALGLYLHWLDSDEVRSDAGTLLRRALSAMDFLPLKEILDLHLAYRDLPSVAIFAQEESKE